MNQENWDLYYLNLCFEVARKSKDPSRKVGAILVKNNQIISTGFNGFPIGVNDCNIKFNERYQRPMKYDFTTHAEVNTIAFAARAGVSSNESTLYCNLFPCTSCAKTLIQAGVKRIVTLENKGEDNGYNFDTSHVILGEAKVDVKLYTSEQLYDYRANNY
jgi:dCMP deaminase